MSRLPEPLPEEVLRNYFHAKDENRPHLLDQVFTPDASLRVHSASSAIAFPAATEGREAIADVLVREFNRTYENIYSFYLARPPATAQSFACDWLVGMTEKTSRAVRVGCGTYEWTFSPARPCLASALLIEIDAMVVMPGIHTGAVLHWLSQLSYPWSSRNEAVKTAPALEDLEPVFRHLAAPR